jgi:hypothetical protein
MTGCLITNLINQFVKRICHLSQVLKIRRQITFSSNKLSLLIHSSSVKSHLYLYPSYTQNPTIRYPLQ